MQNWRGLEFTAQCLPSEHLFGMQSSIAAGAAEPTEQDLKRMHHAEHVEVALQLMLDHKC